MGIERHLNFVSFKYKNKFLFSQENIGSGAAAQTNVQIVEVVEIETEGHATQIDYNCSNSEFNVNTVSCVNQGKITTIDSHETEKNGETVPNCSVCGKYFSRRCSLVRHMVTHSNLRPFECALCFKR